MFLKTLLHAWRSGVLMRHMYDELLQMMQDTEWMFRKSGCVLFEGVDPKTVAEDLYETDRKVNQTERNIRKEIVEHLAIRPKGDVPACLVLMSVVKDAERIGDYCKNLYEVRDILGGPFEEDELTRQLQGMHTRILKTFHDTRKALRESDEAMAREIMGGEKQISHELERKVREVAQSSITARQAVSRALAIRHMKRIRAHLFNIASSVVQPVHEIDYLGQKTPPGQSGKDPAEDAEGNG